MEKSWGERLNSKEADGETWGERLRNMEKSTNQSNSVNIHVETGIYFIQKEILRTVKCEDKDFKIWCGNGELYGYSEDYSKVEDENKILNSENKNANIRYVIQEVKKLA